MYVTVLKIDIPSLTDLDKSYIDITERTRLKLGWMHVRLVFRRSRVRSSDPAAFVCGDGSQNHFYGHYLPTTDSNRAVVSYWRKEVHIILVNCFTKVN